MTNDYFDIEALHSYLTGTDLTKPVFLDKLHPLESAGFVEYESSNTTRQWVPCTISESRYTLAAKYKITLVPLLPGFAPQHYYQLDLAQLVREKHVLTLDPSRPWQEQVPAVEKATLTERMGRWKAVAKRVFSLPALSS